MSLSVCRRRAEFAGRYSHLTELPIVITLSQVVERFGFSKSANNVRCVHDASDKLPLAGYLPLHSPTRFRANLSGLSVIHSASQNVSAYARLSKLFSRSWQNSAFFIGRTGLSDLSRSVHSKTEPYSFSLKRESESGVSARRWGQPRGATCHLRSKATCRTLVKITVEIASVRIGSIPAALADTTDSIGRESQALG